MARKKKEVDELEELEDELEDLEDLDEEEVEDDEDESEDDESEDDESEDDESEDDEDEEDEEETPPKKKRRKRRGDGKVGTAELAEALGTDGRNLRVMLRDRKVKKNPESNRYEWDSVDAALKAMKFKTVADAKKALKASRDKRLEALKETSAEKRAAKKAKGGKKKKASSYDED